MSNNLYRKQFKNTIMHITEKLKRELVNKIEPETIYPVSYTYNQDRTRNNNPTFLKGKDLTENQIIELWKRGII